MYKRFLLSVVAGLCVFLTYAKELKIEDFSYLGYDNISNSYQRKDFNGDVCALIEIEILVKGCRFAEAVGDVSKRDNVYSVYVSPGVRGLQIQCPDHDKLNVKFNSVSNITSVRSGEKYRLVLRSVDNSQVMDLAFLDNMRRGIRADSLILLPLDISARLNERRDSIGERCALIKVAFPIPGCNFSGNVGEAKFDVNEYRVYVSSRAEKLVINCPGFNSDTVSLPGLLNGGGLKAAGTYRMTVSDHSVSFVQFTPEFKRLLCTYENIEDFTEGMAKARRDGKYGIINIEGREVIPCVYDELYKFNEGRAIVMRYGKYGVIDINGREVLPCVYDEIVPQHTALWFEEKERLRETTSYGDKKTRGDETKFEDGLIGIRRNGKWGFANIYGEEFYPLDKYDSYYLRRDGFGGVSSGGKRGIIDIHGKEVVPCEYDFINLDTELPNALAALVNRRGRIFIDRQGNMIEPGKYGYVYAFDSNGLAKVERNGKYGLYNRSGEEVAPCIYNHITEFRNGRAFVSRGSNPRTISGNEGIMDTSGREIIECKYDYISFSTPDSLGSVGFKGKRGLINKNGEEVIPCLYDGIDHDRKDNLISLGLDGKTQIIDRQGNVIIPYREGGIGEFKNGVAHFRHNWKWGVIDMQGNEVIPCIYDYIFIGDDGIFVCKDSAVKGPLMGLFDFKGKQLTPIIFGSDRIYFYEGEGIVHIRKGLDLIFGCINLQGKTLIPLKYSDLSPFHTVKEQRLSIAKLNGKYGIINIREETIVPFIYDYMDCDILCDNDPSQINLFRVKKDGKWGYINNDFKEVIPCIYDDTYGFNKYGWAEVKKHGKQGYINPAGKEIIPCKYDYLGYFKNGIAKVRIGNRWGIINIQGEEIWFKLPNTTSCNL